MLTIIAPRHPERGTEIAEMLRGMGLTVAQRSLKTLPGPATDIYVADTIGELGTFYALTQIAFLGGSLVERGGQNPIEAIRRGAAVISGPSTHNFRDAYETLARHKGVIIASNAAELADAVARLVGDDVEIARMRAGAQAGLATLSGALELTVAELLRHLQNDKELRRVG